MSMAVKEGIGFRQGRKEKRMMLDVIDVMRTYSHVRARREVYVALPQLDAERGVKGKEGARDHQL